MLGESTGHGPVVLNEHGRALDLDEHGRALGLGEGLHHHHHVRLEKSAVDRDIEKGRPHLQQGLGETQSARIHIEVEGNTKKNKTSKYEMSEMWEE